MVGIKEENIETNKNRRTSSELLYSIKRWTHLNENDTLQKQWK